MSLLKKIKVGGSPSSNVVTVTFKSLSSIVDKIKVKKNTTYGEVFNKFLNSDKGRQYNYNDSSFKILSSIINSTEQLEKKITDNVNIKITMMAPVIEQIEPLMTAYNDNEPWPPAKNYFHIEPINFKDVGMMNTGDTIVNSNNGKTNEAKNMIITSTGPTTAQRTAYNKKALLDWFKSCHDRGISYTLPDNRQIVTPAEAQTILKSKGNFEVIDIGMPTSQRSSRRSSQRSSISNRSAISARSNVRERDNNLYAQMYREEIARGLSPDTALSIARERTVARILENRRNAEDAAARDSRVNIPISARSSARSSARATPSPVRDVEYYINLIYQRIDRGHMNDLPQARIREMAINWVAANAARVSPQANQRSSARSNISATPSPRSARSSARSSISATPSPRSERSSARSSISATPSPRSARSSGR
jgi:hypothetical protein